MPNASAETANNTRACERADQNTTLSNCYRQIGISAVAAAARYQGSAKNQAYAPAPVRPQSFAGEQLA